MPFDPILADRIRALVPPHTTEKKLFGSFAFLRGGNFAVAASKDGGIMLRCSREDWQGFVEEAGARPLVRKGNAVSGWVLVAAEAVMDEPTLARWVSRGIDHAESLPPK